MDVRTVRWANEADATYRVVGEGAMSVLAIPGGPGIPAEYLVDFAAGVTDLFRWYLVDPPGTGGTPARGEYRIDDHVAFYRDIATGLGLDRYIVFGHSFGGIVATRLAVSDRDRVAGVVLVGTPVLGVQPDADEGGAIRAAMDLRVERHSGAPWFDEAYGLMFAGRVPDDPVAGMRSALKLSFASPTDAYIDRLFGFLPDGLNQEAMDVFYAEDWNDLDLRDEVRSIERPLLSIVGEHDWESPPQQSALHGALAPRATVVVVPDSGHYVELEQPEAWRDAVRRWATAEVLATS